MIDVLNPFKSNVENELILIFSEDHDTEQEGDKADDKAKQISLGLRGNAVHQDHSYKTDDVIEGI